MMNASADCSPCVALYHVRRGKAARQRKPAEVPRSPRPLVRLDPRCARSCFDAFSLHEPVSTTDQSPRVCLARNALVAPNHVDICGLPRPIVSRNRHGLRSAIRHIRSCRGCDIRRETMDRIPGDIIRVGVMDIARWWLRDLCARFVIGRPVRSVHHARPGVRTVSTVMPERSGDGWASSRMCSRALRGSCACECLARSKD